MKKKLILTSVAVGVIVLLALNAHISYAAPQVVPLASDYEIGWWSVDGGGAQTLTGGAYTLNGTIGQPDAGAQIGTGYALSGGFWIADVFGHRLHLPAITR